MKQNIDAGDVPPRRLVLKFAIVLAGLTQVQLAKAAGISPAKLSRIIGGHVCPTNAERKNIAKVLRAREKELFPEA